MPGDPHPPETKKLSLWRRARIVAWRICFAFGLLVAIYVLIVLLGYIPVNNNFEPTPDGVEIFVTSSSVHADIILPIQSGDVNWRTRLPRDSFSGDTRTATHAVFGWGDKGFYIDTPTWADLKVSTTVTALFWPSGCCIHTSFISKSGINDDARSVRISREQYKKLATYIEKSFKRNDENDAIIVQNAAFGSTDCFYEAHGTYHCMNTCNCWVGAAMRSAGIRCGWFTPMPKSVFVYLP